MLDAQRRAGFQDLAGSDGTLKLALSDALLNRVIAAQLPATWPIKELTLQALDGNEIAVRVRPRASWLPPVQVRLVIDQRPATRSEPFVRARFASSLGGLAGLALGSAPIPGWLRISGDDVTVDLGALARQHGAADMLEMLREFRVRTEPGRVIPTAALAVVPPQ